MTGDIIKSMVGFLSFWLALLFQVGNPQITPLSFEAKSFKQSFNENKDYPRLVGVFSPTCAHCLQTCSEIQSILEENPDSRIKVFLLWSPFELGDNLGKVYRVAPTYLPDSRVSHYWDMWRSVSRTLSPQLRVPVEQAWDMVVFYAPGATWGDEAPKHDFWMQGRNLMVGIPYSRKGLERKLKDWF